MRKLAIFTAAFALAAAGYVYGLPHTLALWIAGVCLVLSALVLKPGFRRFGIVCLGMTAGLLMAFAYDQIYLMPLRSLYDTCQTMTVELTEPPLSSLYGAYSTVRLEVDGKRYEAALYGEEDLLLAAPGDLVTAEMEIESADREDLYLRSKGIVLRLTTKTPLQIEKGEPTLPMKLRLWLQARIDQRYDGEEAGLLRALLTGDRSGLSEPTQYDLSVAGLSHAVAVSGLHVSVLIAMIAFLCGGNPRLTALFGIPLAILFALMTGASPSACRAAVMQVLLLTAPLIRRENDTITSLSAAALILLLQNPWVIANVSFQLSFAAVAGLLLFSGPIQRRLLSLQKKPSRSLRFIASTVSASLSATALTMPLLVCYFGYISIAAVFSNMLLLWAISLILTVGLVSCFVGFLAVPVGILAGFVLKTCGIIASFPYAAAYPQNLPLLLWAVAAYGVAYWLLLGKKRGCMLPLCCLTVTFLACILWGRWNLTHDLPAYHVLNVGQGQCTLLQTEGFTAVLDCGGYDAGESVVQTLHSGGQTHVDALFLTHYDSDHANGTVQVLHTLDVGLLVMPDIPDESGLRRAVEEAAHESGTRVLPVSDLTKITVSDGEFTVYPPVSKENDNNSGISILASALEYDILITGDLDAFMEMRLLSRWELPEVEILVAGHHGAANSTSSVLLETVNPKVVVVSAGEDNPYGHPATETLDRIAQAGAAVFRTDEDGAILLRP